MKNYQDFLYGISLPDIHLDLVFINDVLICQTLCPITLILQLPRYHRKPFLEGTSALSLGKVATYFKKNSKNKMNCGGKIGFYIGE